MKSPEEIRSREIEKCNNYTLREIKANIIFYKTFKFLFSRYFSFILYIFLITFVLTFFHIDLVLKIFTGVVTHFIIFIVIDPVINEITHFSDVQIELDILIEVNTEILKRRSKLD
jgi:hypothetical protein